MNVPTRSLLRRLLAIRYRPLRRRLAQRLGSDSLAGEVLHETWLRLGHGAELGPVKNHEAYIYRAAINVAANMRVANERHARGVVLEEIADLVDETPGADRMAEGKDQVRIVMRALDELSERQRDVFLACFMGDAPSEEIAQRHGVSVRTVQADLRSAVVHCARRLGRKDVLADRNFKVSRD